MPMQICETKVTRGKKGRREAPPFVIPLVAARSSLVRVGCGGNDDVGGD